MEKFFDPFGIASSFGKVRKSWIRNSPELEEMLTELNERIQDISMEEFSRLLSANGFSEKSSGDFKAILLDHVKQSSKLFRKYHRVFSEWLKAYVDRAPDLEDGDRQRAMFWSSLFANAFSPSNFFWTNPGAVKRFIDSNGESLINGFDNWIGDVCGGDNLVRIADPEAFKVGENLAYTPGAVVFRNELMELIQYSPTTESTFAVPIVLVQPWINKFYIFDLTEGNSLVRYLLDQGFTVFITSWKNPTAEMRHIGFEDYMLRGALRAIEVAKEICNVEQVHAAGYCIGGTVLAALMGWLNKAPAQEDIFPIADWTTFSTLVDFSDHGELGVYISEKAVDSVEDLMAAKGYLDKKYIELAFRLLRSDSLIWRYIAHNYLHGGTPPKSDMLYWNSDSTRLPEKMCSFYLREFYLNNKLAKRDELVLAGRPIDLGRIEQPLYAVGAVQDHICPWKETFRICNMVNGPVKYILATEGHITGIVNPPSERSRKKYWAGETAGDTQPDPWLHGQQEHKGSWWTDWVSWLSERSQPMVQPPSMGSKKYPPLEKAPGRYVMEQ